MPTDGALSLVFDFKVLFKQNDPTLVEPQKPHGHAGCVSQTMQFLLPVLCRWLKRFSVLRCSAVGASQSTGGRVSLSTPDFACGMEMRGFEPRTSCLQSRRSPAELHPRRVLSNTSGSEPARTADLSLIRRVL